MLLSGCMLPAQRLFVGHDDTLVDCRVGVEDANALRYEGFAHVMTVRLSRPLVQGSGVLPSTLNDTLSVGKTKQIR